MKFDTVEKFLNYGIFVIPEYQRGYSWIAEQLEDFTNDLSDVEYVKEHYAGTITLIKSGQESIGISLHSKYDIVDGQQRLTTIHLLMISLFHRIKAIDKNAADEIIIKNVLYKGKTYLRLNDEENQEFFSYLLNEEDISLLQKSVTKNKTQKNLLNARVYFYKFFQKYTSIPNLVKIYQNLFSKFKVNVFELEEESEVGLIFETMNDRGLPLSDIDKVKNYLIYLSHKLNDKKLAKDINKKFGEIFSELMKVEGNPISKVENQFLKHCYIIYSGDNKELNDIHKKIKTNLISQKNIFKNKTLFENDESIRNKKLTEIKDFCNFLHKSSENYSLVLSQSFESEQINEKLMRLEVFGKMDIYMPLFLSILGNKKFKNEFLLPIIEILEAFSLRVFTFGNKKGNTGNSALFDLAYRVYNNKLNFTDLKKELRALVAKNSPALELKKYVINASVYNNVSLSAIKLILLDYEKSLQNEMDYAYDLGELKDFLHNSKITVEHISPQILLPGSKVVENLHVLGNLVLTYDNSKLNNKTFASKKNMYKNSNLVSERELSKCDSWDDKTINERSKRIAKFVLENWKVL